MRSAPLAAILIASFSTSCSEDGRYNGAKTSQSMVFNCSNPDYRVFLRLVRSLMDKPEVSYRERIDSRDLVVVHSSIRDLILVAYGALEQSLRLCQT